MPHHPKRDRRLRLETLEVRNALTTGLTPTLAAVPNDPRYPDQWALENAGQTAASTPGDIDASRAWDVNKGSTKVAVAVLDTGIDYSHPDLYLNVWLNQGEIPVAIRSRLTDIDGDGRITFRDLNDTRNQGVGKITDRNGNGFIDGADVLKPAALGGWADGVSNNADAYVDDLLGWNFVNNTNDPYDDHGHGTHISGIIGAVGNNGIGVAGVAWNTQIMGLKVFNAKGTGDTRWSVAAMNYAADMGAKAANVSWVLGSFSSTLATAINRAGEKGVIVVAASGNAGKDNDTLSTYPATSTAPNVITVGALDASGRLANYSNYGVKTVDITAPGSNILSTNPGKSYGYRTGTSMATPFVAGVVALVSSKYPSWSPGEVITQVLNTAVKSTALTGKVATGAVVNAAAAVGAAQSEGVATAPRVVSDVSNGPTATTLSSARVMFDRAMVFSSLTAASVTLTAPNGQRVNASNVKDVGGSGGKGFDLIFPLQTQPGTYTLRIAAVAKDLNGVTMQAFTSIYTRGTTPPTTTAPKVVSAVSAGPTATTLSSARVMFDRAMVFSSLTAASVTLTAPNGQRVTASNVKDVGGSGGKGFDLIFPLQTQRGTYTLRIAPVAKDISGVTMEAFTATFTR